MKIIWRDNFDRDRVDDRLVAENITSVRESTIMLQALQATCTNEGPDQYELVNDDYKLKKWEP